MSHNMRRLSSTYYLLFLCIALTSLHPKAAPTVNPNDETEGSNLFEGDILLEVGEKPYGYRKKRETVHNATIQDDEESYIWPNKTVYYAFSRTLCDEASYIWPNKTVYYAFSQTLSESYRETFTKAIEEWSAHTCLNFEHAEEGQDHLLFVNSPTFGCSSYVGRKGGSQIVSMSDSCFGKGHAIHEIGHSLGLWHEHSRPDRDDFIEVLYENIRESEQDNFGKLTQEKFELVPDVGYDTESIMHYGPYAFSKDDDGPDKKTIQLKDDAPLDYKNCTNLLAMGQRDELSYLDKLRVNKLYSCNAEIRDLEEQGRKCLTPATIPTPTTTTFEPTSTVVTMPTPTTTQPVVPTPSKPKRLQSGSVITLRFDGVTDELEKGVKCIPTCRATSCYSYSGGSTCNGIAHQFEIVVPENPNARKILSGAKVALRSRNNPTQWLDCSDIDSSCSISRCTRNDADSGTNASYITNCQSHYFKIFGVGRREGKLINTNHNIRLKHEYNQSYLDCSVDNKCQLSDSTEPSFKFHIIH